MVKEDENLVATLERHFSAIDSNNNKNVDLENLKEPITNLIMHLKLIWMNTKHFYKDVQRFKNLMDATESEINNKVRKVIKQMFLDIDEENLDLMSLMRQIKSGKEVIITLKTQYHKTKKDVKDDNQDMSWDENNELFKEADITDQRLTEL